MKTFADRAVRELRDQLWSLGGVQWVISAPWVTTTRISHYAIMVNPQYQPDVLPMAMRELAKTIIVESSGPIVFMTMEVANPGQCSAIDIVSGLSVHVSNHGPYYSCEVLWRQA